MLMRRRRLKGIRGHVFISLVGFVTVVFILKSRRFATSNVDKDLAMMRELVAIAEGISRDSNTSNVANVVRELHVKNGKEIFPRAHHENKPKHAKNARVHVEGQTFENSNSEGYSNLNGNSSLVRKPLPEIHKNLSCGPHKILKTSEKNIKSQSENRTASDKVTSQCVNATMIAIKQEPVEPLTTSEDQRRVPCLTIGVLSPQNAGKWDGGYVCPETGCYVMVKQSLSYKSLEKTRALYIPQLSLFRADFKEMNRLRSPNQIWVFNSFESPVHTHPLDKSLARHGFNWTFTYRRDSTFPSPYGKYIPGKPLVPPYDSTNWAENKTKFAAWIGSNCHNTQWPRLDFVKKLQKLIPLDTFGSCGTNNCPKNPKCGETLLKYKFYFALENSHCKDYITEKFWRAPFKNNMIPVVYGPPRADYEGVAPPRSFIHLDDFKTISQLADYLKLLDRNDTLYNEYFEWKRIGHVEMDLIGQYYISRNVMCPIAGRIKDREGSRTKNTTEGQIDMKTWWTNSCQDQGRIRTLLNT